MNYSMKYTQGNRLFTVVAPTPGTSSTSTLESETSPTSITLKNLDHSDGTSSDFQIGIDNNRLFIKNTAESKGIYIKMAFQTPRLGRSGRSLLRSRPGLILLVQSRSRRA